MSLKELIFKFALEQPECSAVSAETGQASVDPCLELERQALQSRAQKLQSMNPEGLDDLAAKEYQEKLADYNLKLNESALLEKYEALLADWHPGPDYVNLKKDIHVYVMRCLEAITYCIPPVELNGEQWRDNELARIGKEESEIEQKIKEDRVRVNDQNRWIGGLMESMTGVSHI